jgi:L-amino acid N-acyltransferase YncA
MFQGSLLEDSVAPLDLMRFAGGISLDRRHASCDAVRVNVRRATAVDVPAIAEVHVCSWHESYVGQVPQSYLDGLAVEDRTRTWHEWTARAEWPNPDLLVLVDDDDVVVGFASVSASHDRDAATSTGEVAAIYTRQRVWGRGWGRALMDAAIARLRQAGYGDATLWVLDTNHRARRFYQQGGWCWDGTTKSDVIGGRNVTELRYRVAVVSGRQS